jgi:hypothetical protein
MNGMVKHIEMVERVNTLDYVVSIAVRHDDELTDGF